jgi:uncharacterized damage-inducible protein DinB
MIATEERDDVTAGTILAQLAAYNAWANARLYGAALAVPEAAYRRRVGVFFGSLHGTLNHLLLTDRLWPKRLTGTGEQPNALDAILYELTSLRQPRRSSLVLSFKKELLKASVVA